MSNSRKPNSRSTQLSVECLEDRITPTFATRGTTDTININGVNLPAGGVSIAAGNLFPNITDPVTGQDQMEYVTGTGPGTDSLVRVWNSQTGALLSSFSPFPGFKGGVNVAVGDVLGLGTPQIVVAVASGGPPVVAVFSPLGQLESEFFLLGNTTFMGGLSVAVGHVSGALTVDAFEDTANQPPDQIVLGTASQAAIVAVTDAHGNVSSLFQAFPGFNGGVNLAVADIDSTASDPTDAFGNFIPNTNAYAEILVGAASQAPAVAVYDVWTGSPVERSFFFAFAQNSGAGVTLAAGPTAEENGAQIFVSLLGTSNVNVFDGASDTLQGTFTVYPPGYSAAINLVFGYFTPGGYDPTNTGFNYYDCQDLAVVAGDGSFQQQPRYFIGLPDSPAGFNGPSASDTFLL